MNYKAFIGQAVINVHRPRGDGGHQQGILVDVLDGINTLVGITWQGRDYVSWMAPQDIALEATYPGSRFGDAHAI